jgi:peptidoglycan/LPS O-acetylase OafA/YrhL
LPTARIGLRAPCVGANEWGQYIIKTESGTAAADAYSAFLSTKYFGGLDALRAFSVLAVIWTHVTTGHTVHLLTQGHRGVDLFFAISGFLVTTLLLREYRRNGRISIREFYMRRTLRIFPLYYAVLALYCVLVFFTLRGTPKAAEFWDNLPAFATYTSNWFVSVENGAAHGVTFYFAWSLATEEQFYLFWPSLMVLLLWWGRKDWLLALAATALVGVQVYAASWARATFLATVFASLAPAILFGVTFAVLLNNKACFKYFYLVLGRKYAAPVAFVLLLLCLQFGAPWLFTAFMMALLVAAVCIREDTWLHPILRWRPAAFVGTISYGIYLMHMLAANGVRAVLRHPMGIDVFLLTIPVVVAMAYVSYRFFESPILRYKDRFNPRPGAGHKSTPISGTANV